MATGPTTLVTDVIVPEVFTGYMQNLTKEKTAIIQSGAVSEDALLSSFLAGGGLTITVPSFKDLDNEAENVMTDNFDDVYATPAYNTSNNSVPKKIETLQEVAVRMNRHQSWSSTYLAKALAGADPFNAIANLVAGYWARRRQAAFMAVLAGIFADNDAAPGASEHVQGDLTFDASVGSFNPAVTAFSAENYLAAAQTMGDSQDSLALLIMHSVVYNRAKVNNLISFVPESSNSAAASVPTFLGKRVIVDDGMPNSGGVFQTFLLKAGAVGFGSYAPDRSTELERAPRAGGGAGQDILHSRVQWCFHPYGHAYVGTPPAGGPSNAATSNNLAAAGSWQRRYPERKQIGIARLLTREF